MDTAYEKVIADFSEECTENGCDTATKVKKHIKKTLNNLYKGLIPQWKIDFFIDEFTESVCLRLGIAHDVS